jgi:Fe-S-cluster containining protein
MRGPLSWLGIWYNQAAMGEETTTALTIRGQRCTGICCSRFPINMNSPEHVRMIAAGKLLSDACRLEMIMVADMLIPLAEKTASGTNAYTCRHWDHSTGRCQIYDQRPDMCRRFPSYGGDGSCQFCGLTSAELNCA